MVTSKRKKKHYREIHSDCSYQQAKPHIRILRRAWPIWSAWRGSTVSPCSKMVHCPLRQLPIQMQPVTHEGAAWPCWMFTLWKHIAAHQWQRNTAVNEWLGCLKQHQRYLQEVIFFFFF